MRLKIQGNPYFHRKWGFFVFRISSPKKKELIPCYRVSDTIPLVSVFLHGPLKLKLCTLKQNLIAYKLLISFLILN